MYRSSGLGATYTVQISHFLLTGKKFGKEVGEVSEWILRVQCNLNDYTWDERLSAVCNISLASLNSIVIPSTTAKTIKQQSQIPLVFALNKNITLAADSRQLLCPASSRTALHCVCLCWCPLHMTHTSLLNATFECAGKVKVKDQPSTRPIWLFTAKMSQNWNHTLTVGEVALDNSDVSADCSTVSLESCSSITNIQKGSTRLVNETRT